MLRLGTVKQVGEFKQYLQSLGLLIPCDQGLECGADESPLLAPLSRGECKIGNRIAINPMEGWDGTADGRPSEHTLRRWRRFGQSGAKLIWGGEAVAVSHGGRANPNQLVIREHTRDGRRRPHGLTPSPHCHGRFPHPRSSGLKLRRHWRGRKS